MHSTLPTDGVSAIVHSQASDFSSAQQANQLNLAIVRESLRQVHDSFTLAKHSFQLHMLMTALCGIIGIFGVGMLLGGQAAEGAATTTGGVTSSVVFSQLSKSAREQLDKANARLDNIRAELWEGELTALFLPGISNAN